MSDLIKSAEEVFEGPKLEGKKLKGTPSSKCYVETKDGKKFFNTPKLAEEYLKNNPVVVSEPVVKKKAIKRKIATSDQEVRVNS